jgi:AmmeMemoRadiSam system protein A
MEDILNKEEQEQLLGMARQALEDVTNGKRLEPLDLQSLPPRLRQPGATFVTLTRANDLRGCIGTLEALLPLAEDVREHAVAAATQDYRFMPVQAIELPEIKIEISRLTDPKDLSYDTPEELLDRLRPHIDGVILREGMHRATFLPQVWEKLPDGEEFLSHLCMKMGAPPDLWRYRKLQVQVYQVEEFHE